MQTRYLKALSAGQELISKSFFAEVCVAAAPTVDAVQVVRCKKCAFSQLDGWFCGGRPVRECLSDGKEYIICSNVNCPCQPMTAAYKSKGAAARAWNRRTDNGF